MFKLIPNFSLKDNNSFGMDIRANYWLSVGGAEDWELALTKYPHIREEKRLIIGGGTNLLFLSDFDGLALSPDMLGCEISYQDSQIVELTVGAGVEWDDFVAFCVENQWYGIENLSLIPGRVGAAPVQNIGAYGVEVGDLILKVNGINLETSEVESYSNEECQFNYRTSIFKEQLCNRLMVTSVVFRLQKRGEVVSGYGDLSKVLKEMGGSSLQNARRAVIQIRQSKLPDPKKLGNAGSFFKNPVLEEGKAIELARQLPGLPVYPYSTGFVKVGAGFLIEQAGWKGRKFGRAAVHERQALVLVNLNGASGMEILELSQAIQRDVSEKFEVTLEHEIQVIE
jgi:UDP-N-acetylmuramate dehydrogenase